MLADVYVGWRNMVYQLEVRLNVAHKKVDLNHSKVHPHPYPVDVCMFLFIYVCMKEYYKAVYSYDCKLCLKH